jgi:hypothetical protein
LGGVREEDRRRERWRRDLEEQLLARWKTEMFQRDSVA